jgi:hypothetical protein
VILPGNCLFVLFVAVPEELHFLAGMGWNCRDDVLVLVFVHAEDYDLGNGLIVKVDVQLVALGLGQHDNGARAQRGDHHDRTLRDAVLLGVLVGELVQLIVGNSHEVTIGYSH